MNFKRIKAYFFLGWHFFTHFLKKISRRAANGLPAFFANYSNDHIFAIDRSLRARMPSFSHCTVCRACDTVCPQILTRPGLVAPSYVVAGFSRSLPDFAYFRKETFDCGSCRHCEAACPQDVPIREIVDFMTSQSTKYG